MYSDSERDQILHPKYKNYKSLVFCETKAPTKDRNGHTPLYLTRQGIFVYLNDNGYPMVFLVLVIEQRTFYCWETFRSIAGTYMLKEN